MFRLLLLTMMTGLALNASPMAADDASPPDGRSLLDLAVQAIGSPEAFDAIEAVEFVGKSSSSETSVEEGANTRMLFVFPAGLANLWMDSAHESPNGVFLRTLAGDRSWASGVGHLAPDLHSDAVRYASTKLLTILRYRGHPTTEVMWRGSEKVDGEVVDLVAVTLFGNTSVLEIVRPTGRVAGVRFDSSEIQEGVAAKEVRRAYSDYRQVQGFRVPFLQQVFLDGEPYNRWQLSEIRFNPTYDATVFDRATEGESE